MENAQRMDGVIFDLDGVLVATDELHRRAWMELCREEGMRFDPELGKRLRGLGREESLEVILENSSQACNPDRKRELAERKNVVFSKLARDLRPDDALPGVVRLLSELQELGIKTSVASSSRNARLVLEHTGLADHFDAVVDGHDARRSKPDPELFLLAAHGMGLPPARCLVIEDAPAGVEGARRAGMTVLGVGAAEELPQANRVVPSLARVTADELLSLAAKGA